MEAFRMQRSLGLAALLAFTVSLVACGGGGGGGGGLNPPANNGGGSTPPPGVSGNSIGAALPTSAIGVVIDPTWGTVGGFTQSNRSQVIAFAPGTQITLKNLAAAGTGTVHTMNVISTSAGPQAAFPASPSLSTTASGGTALVPGFASGNINPGAQMTVTLTTAGTFLVGCAYHYQTNAMRDVIQVSASATPGPEATPQPSSGGGGGCVGVYC